MTLRNALLASLIILTLHSCQYKNSTAAIEGMWISTEETSALFNPWADNAALLIRRDSTGMWAARGFFLKNNGFKAEWNFNNVQYDPVTESISLLDEDSDTLLCRLDVNNEILIGAIHTQDEKNPLHFIRAGNKLENRLLYPRFPDGSGRTTYAYSKPVQVNDGLQTGSIYRYTADSTALSGLMKEVIDQKYGKIKSLLILKDNKLLAEEYFYDYNAEDLQQLRSCTKSITSILLGMVLDRHPDVTTGRSVFTFFPAYNAFGTAGREKITIDHLLTMTAGYQWDDIPAEMFEADDCIEFILSRPLEAEPGEKFNYNSGCSNLLGGIISHIENTKTQAFADSFLFKPLGITEYDWETHKDGTLQCGNGLSLRSRDMAKIGLLVLNDGMWQGKRLVSKEWIRESTRPHVTESPYFNYGYHWWHHSRNNLQWWKEPNAASPDEHDLITALGHGGQYIMIIRDLNLVVVTTASDFENGHIARSKIPLAIEGIVPLFEDSKGRESGLL
ncbi:MAG: serine hydrolase [Calditrichaeota bacterium]|nr:serine hydrolase [Calditrichota bacterium]